MTAPEAMREQTETTQANDGPQMGSLAGRLIRGSSWRVIAMIMPLFVNLALTPYVITTLGRVGYGLWLVSTTLATLIAHFDGGIGRSAQYYFAILTGKGDATGLTRLLTTLACVAPLVSAVILAPAFILAPQIASFFQAPDRYADDMAFMLRWLFILMAVGLVRNLFASVLHAGERFGLSSLSTLLSYAAYAVGMVLVLSQGMGLRGVTYAFIAQHAVATFMIIPPALRYLNVSGIGFVSRAELIEVGKVSWRVQVSSLLSIASIQGVLLIVGRLRPLQVPDFGPGSQFAQQLRMIPMMGVAPVQAILGKTVGRLGAPGAAAEFAQLQRMWVRGITGWIFVGAPAAYVGVNVWLPLEGHLAGQVAAVMLAAQFFSLLPQVLVQWLLLLGKAQYEMWASVITVALLFAFSLALVPFMGAMGAAVGAVIGQLAGVLALVHAAHRLDTKVPNPLRVVPWWQAIVAGALSWVLTWEAGNLVNAGHLPDGGLGLLLTGAAAAPAMLIFLLMTWGTAPIGRVIGRLRNR